VTDGVDLRLGAAGYPLTPVEAETVRDWLSGTRSLAAQTLSAGITEKLDGDDGRSRSLRLGFDDIAALRDVICGADVGEYDGLRSLQMTLCAEI